MPCTLTGSLEGDRALDAQEARQQVTKLANLLCQTCLSLESVGELSKLPTPVFRWWQAHKKLDRKVARKKKRIPNLKSRQWLE